ASLWFSAPAVRPLPPIFLSPAVCSSLPWGRVALTLPPMLKAIVFDFDGVLVDSEPLHYRAFLEVSRRKLGLSFDYEEYLDRLVGYDDRDGFRLLLTEAGQQHEQAELEARIAQLCQQKQQTFEQ